MTKPQQNINIAIQCEGLIILSTMLLGTSSKVYGTKKIVTAVLYMSVLLGILRSSVMPAIFAFPTVDAISKQLVTPRVRQHTIAAINESNEIE